jgi:hypothetical protein
MNNTELATMNEESMELYINEAEMLEILYDLSGGSVDYAIKEYNRVMVLENE